MIFPLVELCQIASRHFNLLEKMKFSDRPTLVILASGAIKGLNGPVDKGLIDFVDLAEEFGNCEALSKHSSVIWNPS